MPKGRGRWSNKSSCHLAVGGLVEHQTASRSIGLRHPTGNRNRVLTQPAHLHRSVEEAELNPGRFTRPLLPIRDKLQILRKQLGRY